MTIHPGSRTTSYLQPGDAVSPRDLPAARPVDHWYFVNGIDVVADRTPAAVAILGDSITDGRGSTTNGNDRWPDELARRLPRTPGDRAGRRAQPRHRRQPAAARRPGAERARPARPRRARPARRAPGWSCWRASTTWGRASAARAKGEPWATADDIIAAYEQIVAARARARYARVRRRRSCRSRAFENYFGPDVEADRQAVNRLDPHERRVRRRDRLRRGDARPAEAVRTPAAAVDGGDHLHPGVAGHKRIAAAVDLALFGSAKRGRP